MAIVKTSLFQMMSKISLTTSIFMLSTFSGILFAADAVSQSSISLKSGVWPVMIRMDYNPVLQIGVDVNASEHPVRLDALKVDFSKTTNVDDIDSVDLFIGGSDILAGKKYGTARPSKANSILTIKGKGTLEQGKNEIWLSVRLKNKASIAGKISAVASQMVINGKPYVVNAIPVDQRIGYAVAKAGDLGSKNYRIPAMVRTKSGTLVATFDIRYNHSGDLPANIDVGVSRSKDGGRTWTPVEAVLSSKEMEVKKGIGDPGILFDDKTGNIWISALWAPQSGHPIWNSSTGTDSPEKCGQMILICSKNDGKTWSKPINITSSIKRLNDADTKEWALVFHGPGAGICTKDGTLIFPAQIWGNEGKGIHHGVLVYSKDSGKTWTSSKQMPFGGSESTCVELKNGAILLNTREGQGGFRAGGITKDLGETWKKADYLWTDEGRLRQPGGCQAALLTADGKQFYFSNPDSGRRDNMTLKYSRDSGKSWNKGLLYDERKCAGYSTISFVDDKDKNIGVLYEGAPDSQTLFFLSIPSEDVKKVK